MTPNKDVVEYYDSEATPGRDLVVALESSIVPPVGTFVNIGDLLGTLLASATRLIMPMIRDKSGREPA